MIVNGNEIKEPIVAELKDLAATHPKQAYFIQFGDDPASTTFVNMKLKFAKSIGVTATYVHSQATTTAEALAVIGNVMEKPCDGIVIQLPLPASMDVDLVIDSVPTECDVDVLSEDAKAQYVAGTTERVAPVAAALQEILWHHKIMLIGKKIVVIGKGRLVGEPIMMLLDRQGVSYTIIDKETPDTTRVAALQEADVIISGTGVPHSITPDMIKEGVVLIDAGTAEQTGKLVGDIDPACADKASFYTPVPGGVGPLTIPCLFRNLFLK